MLKGKTALVTGSTSGIGLAIARVLAGQGCNIIFNGFGDKAEIDSIVSETASKYSVKSFYSDADMSKPEMIHAMIDKAENKYGGVDILVNNAGIQHTAPVADFADSKWDAIIAINLSSVFHTIHKVLPKMQERGFGRIINIASVHGLVASKQKSAYVAAKHGVVGLTKVVALEAAESGVTVNAICPAWVHTPLVQKQIEDKASQEGTSVDDATKNLLGEKQPNKQFIQPESIGAMIAFLCGEHAESMTGEIVTMSGGWLAQ